ncbi:MAG: fibronectin type III domain-containing protein [Candidatus Yanofskybacteria bacterium]|nr:fibronectin type III domain-containing protein [Candidatus Yanofskybacteria bacterium]
MIISGSTSTNYPVSFARPFVQGEIANFPQALVNGTAVTTQADVKTRWSDGSVKHAVISFLMPTITAGSNATVTFQNQTSGNNTPLTQAQMLGANFDFDATISINCGLGAQTKSARTMLANGHYTVWTSGQIVQTIILADDSVARTYDMGCDANRSFRPRFEATFWPGINKVSVRAIGEISTTGVLQDQSYSLAITVGFANPSTVYSRATFTQTAMSRWIKPNGVSYWIGGTPATVNMDHNLSYVLSTKSLPNYDQTKIVSNSTITSACNNWNAAAKDLYDSGDFWQKSMGAPGSRPEIAPFPKWSVQWIFAMGSGNASAPCLKDRALGMADLAAAWPVHVREGNSAKSMDRAGTVSGIGRVMSISQRPTLSAGQRGDNWSVATGADSIGFVGSHTSSGWNPQLSHLPEPFYVQYLLTGDHWYLEELMFWSGWVAFSPDGSVSGGDSGSRGPNGTFGAICGWAQGACEIRGEAWGLRTRAASAFIIPDGTPEKTYFSQLMDDTLAAWEGARNIIGTSYQGNTMWNWGNTTVRTAWPPSPLRQWERGNSGEPFTDWPVDGTQVSRGEAFWMNNMVTWALGFSKQLGFKSGDLLTWSSPFIVNTITDPAYNPYLIGAYEIPVIKTLTNSFYTTFSDLKTGFVSTVQNSNCWDTIGGQAFTNTPCESFRLLGDADGGYPYIAMAACSQIAGETGGSTAWNWCRDNILNQTLVSPNPLNNNPIWAIVPAGAVSPPPPPTPDTTVPTVFISAPTSGSTVSGSSISVSATASDNVGVVGVQFKLDGVNLGTEVTLSPFSISWNTTTTTNGSHMLSAVARDAAGNSTTSPSVTVTVSQPPVISSVLASNISNNSAVITWSTDKPSTSKINYGLSSSYTISTVVDNTLVTNHSVALGGLTSSTLYHYQVESTDSGNLTSVSSDGTFTTASPAPIISNIQATGITSSGATITWLTDIPANSQVEYGLTVSYGSATILDSALVTNHSVALTGLNQTTTYNYRVKSNGSVSINSTFSTPGLPDTTPPSQITNLNAVSATQTSITLSWSAPGDDNNVGTASTYQMRWSTIPITDANWNAAFILSGLPAPQIANTTQSYIAIGLSPNVLHYFAMKTLDEANNISPLSNVSSRTTVALPPADTTAPVISNILANSLTTSGATVTWTTNEASDTQVEYGTTTSYGSSTTLNTSLVTSHLQLLSGLSAGTLYHYRVKSKDAAGNLAVSGDLTFTTLSPPDITAPVISNIQTSNITANAVTINWTTNEVSDTQVEYGLTTAYGSQTVLNTTMLTAHSVSLTSLSAGTTYNFRVKSRDAAGNSASGSNQSFTTSSVVLPADIVPPVVSGIQIIPSPYDLTISWNTNEPAISKVNYGTSSAYGSASQLSATLSNTHQVVLAGLLRKTSYNIQIVSTDAAGNTVMSLNQVSATLARLAKPPKIANLVASNGSVILSWGAPVDDNGVPYELYAGARIYRNTTGFLTTPNSAQLLAQVASPTLTYTDTGTTNGTTYYYTIFSYDDQGIVSDPAVLSFTPTAPVISGGGGGGGSGGGGGGGGSTIDLIPPQPVKLARVVEADGMILLEWDNPSDTDFVRVLIVQNTEHQPLSPDDGQAILEDNVKKSIVVNLQNGKTYYFNIYALDLAKNFSKPLEIKAVPKEGVTSFPEFSRPLDIAQTTGYVAPKLQSTVLPGVGSSLAVYPSGVLIRGILNKSVYLIEGGTKRWVPSWKLLQRLAGTQPKVVIVPNPLAIDSYPFGKPLSDKETPGIIQTFLLKGKSAPTVFMIDSKNNIKRPISSVAAFYSLGFGFNHVGVVDDKQLDKYQTGDQLSQQLLPDGSLIKPLDSPRVYILHETKKRWVTTADIFKSYGFDFSKVITLPNEVLETYAAGNDITQTTEKLPYPASQQLLPDGSLIKPLDSPKVYILHETKKRWVTTADIFKSYGFDFSKVIVLPNEVLETYAAGNDITQTTEKLPYPNGTLVKLTDDPKVYVFENNQFRWINSPEVLVQKGYRFQDITLISSQALSKHVIGEPVK